jgi:hypothetical protein
MRDLAIAISSVFTALLGGLGIGGILYVLAKHYVKSRFRRGK